MSRLTRSLSSRVIDGMEPDLNAGCWLWGMALNKNGYGVLHRTKRDPPGSTLAHRIAYECLVGPIPDGLGLDHLCRVRCCVNPKHLEPVPQKTNLQRSPYFNGRKIKCSRGHDLTAEAAYINPGTGARQCRECVNLTHRLARTRRKHL